MRRILCLILISALLLAGAGCAARRTETLPEPEALRTQAPSVTAAPDPTVAPGTDPDEPAKEEEADAEQIRQARELLKGDKPVQVIDLRGAEAYAAGHLPHAMLLEEKDLTDRITALLPLKNTVLLVCGNADHPAGGAVEKLKGLGYLFVHSLDSLSGWTDGLETGEWVRPEDKKQDFTSFIASDLSGLWVDETIFAGHDLTMINLWATFCGPCLMEMPDLGALHDEYADRGFQVVGIVVDALNADGTIPMSIVEKARAIVETTSADYPHLLPTEQLVKAKVDEVMYVPETIFVNSRGEIVGESFVGARSGDDWRPIIEEYLKQVDHEG